MKRFLATVTALAGVLLLAGCSTVETKADWDTAVDFGQYKTFSIIPAKEVQNPMVRQRVESAIVATLGENGLTKAGEDADLLVGAYGSVSSQTQIDSYGYGGYGYGYGGAWAHGYWGGGMGMTTTTVREVPVGTLVIDLVDAKAKKLVWRGTASSVISGSSSPEQMQQKINGAVDKMFYKYPPKPGKK
jgi:hypothetical protein